MTSLTLRQMSALMPPRAEDSNKASFGHVLNIAGSINYRGAAYLSSLAALRVGAGYVTLSSSPSVCQSVSALSPNLVLLPLLTQASEAQTSVNEASLIEVLSAEAASQILPLLKQMKAISLGSGLGLIQAYLQPVNGAPKLVFPGDNYPFFCALLLALQHTKIPLVLDADGLNFLARAPLSHPLPINSILTPHPKELARLLAIDVSVIQANRVHYAKHAATQFNAVVVLKGKDTVITDGKKVFINPTGSSVLAKAGTGDVLTGMIAGFCAQGMTCIDAACLGVYLHGLAGDLAAKELSAYSMLASELLDYIPKAIIKVLQAKDQN
jgi:hydroxyethylthiazole kinase-like uncharacterized protein yjeF